MWHFLVTPAGGTRTEHQWRASRLDHGFPSGAGLSKKASPPAECLAEIGHSPLQNGPPFGRTRQIKTGHSRNRGFVTKYNKIPRGEYGWRVYETVGWAAACAALDALDARQHYRQTF